MMMKTVKKIIYTLSFSMLLIACEKEIDLDLKESEQLTVVEGIVYDNLGDNFVKLSKTRSFNNNGEIESISNATVQISDGAGGVFTLIEVDSIPGYYTNPNLIGVAGRTYELIVTTNGKTFTSSSLMSPRIEIDSLSYDELPKFNPEDSTEYSILCHFKDPENVVNYYRMKAFSDGVQKDGFINWDDVVIDGLSTALPVFEATYFEGENATVHLLSVDEANFRYFEAVRLSQGGEVPGNPESNIKGDKVVGYFGAYAKSEYTVTIVE